MKRKIAVAVAIMVPVGVIVFGMAAIMRQGMPGAAQAAISQYLAYRFSSPPPAVRSVSEATRPWVLRADLSSATYSDSAHYDVTVNLHPVATQPIKLMPSPASSQDAYRRSDGLAALPYPPEDVWCVRLEGGEQTPMVVLVALHNGLYNADWVVHEIPANWSAGERSEVLADLGCEVETGR